MALAGGAIYGDYTALDIADSTLSSSMVFATKDDVVAEGGAIALSNGYARIISSVFENNLAVLGGALSLNGVQDTTVNNCTFTRNYGENSGAIYSNSTDGSIITISNSKFNNNLGTNGNAIFNDGELMLSVTQSIQLMLMFTIMKE